MNGRIGSLFFLLLTAFSYGDPVVHIDGDLPAVGFVSKGGVKSTDGPVSPEYPGFPMENKGIYLDGSGRLMMDDPGKESDLDFTNGDRITLEAWGAPEIVPEGQNIYVIGKGRTGNAGFMANNQNYALRLRGKNGQGCASFLFYSQPTEKHPGNWHRWTTNIGVIPGDGWGHIAVSYEFGKPESIRGYVNGQEVSGTWDMGGATKLAPVVDDDQLLIGAALGGSPNSSFHGRLDNVSIHREVLSSDILKSRYQRDESKRKVVVFERENWPEDSVEVELFEGVNMAKGWPAGDLPKVASYHINNMAFFRVLNKYSEEGIRIDYPKTFFLRALTTITLPEGEHEWLVRQRWATKLWMDGKLVLNLPQTSRKGGAHGSVPVIAKDWPNYLRIPGPGDKETRFRFISDGKPVQVRMEFLIGDQKGKSRYRHDLGETCVAVSISGSPFQVVGPKDLFPLTDFGWSAWRRREEVSLQELDAESRRVVTSKTRKSWQKRHDLSRSIIENQSLLIPKIPDFLPVNNPVDQFIGKQLIDAAANSNGKSSESERIFLTKVQPVLKEKCIKCHHGKKAKGGLHLDSLEGMLTGGDSGDPALVPGNVGKSLMFALAYSRDEDERMPPKGDLLNAGELRALREWIQTGAKWPEDNLPEVADSKAPVTAEELKEAGLYPAKLTDDLTFLRRVTLDTIGVFPTPDEIETFLKDDSPDKRAKVINRLLDHPGWAHHWVGYWQDVLAENPNILKPRLNNTGPFRDWIFESFLDNKPMDQFVAELILMGGSKLHGGPAGFGVATQNDAPMAAKAHVLGTAFLGTNLQCARCHDAPYHPYKQKDLFGMAAMLNRNSLRVPESSRAKLPDIGDRKPLIEVTLKPNEAVPPVWGFSELLIPELTSEDPKQKKDPRQELAEIITSPLNQRFAEVMANRIWMRYFGVGLMESADDWHNLEPSHPELLRYLARKFVTSGYDMKSMARLILNSHAYQRVSKPASDEAAQPMFTSQLPRRLAAEQIVDGLYHATGLPMEVGELNMDRDGSRGSDIFLNLGHPRRSWQYISLSNERDRPSLAFPRIQAVIDTLKQFGWRPSRQEPLTERESSVHALQPGILANGVLTTWLTRLSPQHGITEVCLESDSVEELLVNVFQRFLTRSPTEEELARFSVFLSEGFADRIIPAEDRAPYPWPKKIPAVSWSNHLSPEANSIMIELEKRARDGDPPTNALQPEWREKMEDVIWAMINSPELMFVP